jgi:hypothetical protein
MVRDGSIAKGAAITHSVTNFTGTLPTDSIFASADWVVYPSVQLNVASLIVAIPGADGTPFTLNNISIGFNNMVGGKRYVLEMRVRRTRWARSNIYWQAVATGQSRAPGYLTFDVTGLGH